MPRITRRAFLPAVAAAGAFSAAARSGRPSNVLVFMTDQESALLPGPVDTPNRARLDRGAVRFTNCFCNTPQCSAARSSLLTGLEPHHTGVLTNVDGSSLGKPLPASIPTLAGVLREAGYSTGYFGKWHLGQEKQGPAAFGFSDRGDGRDEEVARQAAEWVRRQKGPWLAWVSVINPHDIYGITRDLGATKPRPGVKAPFSHLDNLAGKPSEQREYVDKDQGRATREYTTDDWVRYRSYYCSLVDKADQCFGTVLDAVPDPASAVIVYTSDHGDALGEHGLPFKGPFMYDELIRIPLSISAPGRKPAAREDFVVQADLAPTLAALAGTKWPSKTDGVNLFGNAPARDAVFLEYYAKQKWVNPIRTIRTREWKLNWYDRGNRELYHLTEDPHETRNVAGSYERVRAELEARLSAWRGPVVTAAGK